MKKKKKMIYERSTFFVLANHFLIWNIQYFESEKRRKKRKNKFEN